MNCLFCDEEINKYSIYDLLFEEDMLCPKCREAMKLHIRNEVIDGIHIEFLYDYDSLFRDILIQYKECYDEALKDVFLHQLKDHIRLKYIGYKILYAPSTSEKLKERGFNHLKLIFESLHFKELEGLRQKEELIQRSKTKFERMKMEKNFIYEGQNADKVLIVDDVYTTGSTIRGVYDAICPFAKKVKVLVLSR